MNQPSDFIEVSLSKPQPEKPGYLIHDRNLTIRELNDAIQSQLDPRIKRAMEWNGIPPAITLPLADSKLREDSPLPPCGHPFPEPDLRIEWRPGGSEGYVVSVYARRNTEPDPCVWHAKLFDLDMTLALHTALMRLIYWHGTRAATHLLRVQEQLLSMP
jgi:hypothetical protein